MVHSYPAVACGSCRPKSYYITDRPFGLLPTTIATVISPYPITVNWSLFSGTSDPRSSGSVRSNTASSDPACPCHARLAGPYIIHPLKRHIDALPNPDLRHRRGSSLLLVLSGRSNWFSRGLLAGVLLFLLLLINGDPGTVLMHLFYVLHQLGQLFRILRGEEKSGFIAAKTLCG